MGTVFRAVDTLSGADVAVKQLHAQEGSCGSSVIERLRREADALKRLNHPCIVRVHDVAWNPGQMLLIMEYVAGGSLAQLLASSNSVLALDRVLTLALDICDALSRSHRLGIIHRDIKPSNVLLSEDGSPRLADFGAAFFHDLSRITERLGVVGTLEYLSPEALAGDEPDPRTDVWGIGVLLFEMLTRQHPFARANLAQTLAAINSSSPPELERCRPDCPPALIDLIYRMLAKSRDERVNSIRHVGAELDDVLHRRSARPAREGYLASKERISTNLPSQSSTLVGREHEVAQLLDALNDEAMHLMTLVAPGGMGKTRLAVEFAQHLICAATRRAPNSCRQRFQDGVYIVYLAPLTSTSLIPVAIAEALGCHLNPAGEPLEQLKAQLKSKRLLLLLDNFEHLLEGAPIVSSLLQAAPHLTVVVTSRERLGLCGEWVFPLGCLPLPSDNSQEQVSESSAVSLFLQVARTLRSDFELTHENSEDVARVCRLVDGIPLGIILAASWIGSLSPSEIADEIASSLDFLAVELRDLPERQRSIRATFEHSWALLSGTERSALASLSVFRGGFVRDAAQSVVGISVHTLTALCNKSLLRRFPNGGRFEMHELLRQFADSKLALDPERQQAVLRRYGSYFSRYVAERVPRMRGPNPRQALCEVEAELDNVRATWIQLLEAGRLEELDTMLEGLELLHTRRAALNEGAEAFAALIDAMRGLLGRCEYLQPDTGASDVRQIRCLLGRGLAMHATYLRQRGQCVLAREQLSESLSLLEAPAFARERAHALVALGNTEAKIGNLHDAHLLVEQGVACYRFGDDTWGLAVALETLGWLHSIEGNLPEAERVYREAADIQRLSGHFQSALMGLGTVTADQGRYEDGCQLMQQALELFQSAGDCWNTLRCQNSLANVQRKIGNYELAEAIARACRNVSREVCNRDHEAWAVFQLANILKEQRRLDEAEAEIAVAYAMSRDMHDIGKLALAELELGDLAFLRGDYALAERQLNNSLVRFESSRHTWGAVLANDHLGYLACFQQHWDCSKGYFSRALRLSLAGGLVPFAVNIVAGIALLKARTARVLEAVELLSLARSHPAAERHTLNRRVNPLLEELESSLSSSPFNQALVRGATLELEAVELLERGGA